MGLFAGFFDKKTNINIKQANSLKVVPPKKAGVKCSWFFRPTISITATIKNVMPDIKKNKVQKLGVSKPVLPVYCSTAGGMAIMMINNRKKRMEEVTFIDERG
jgi:hypothetical protein